MGQWSVVISGSAVDIDTTYGVKTSHQLGHGMPPLEHNVTPYALLPGALYQGYKVQPRELVLTFNVKGSSLANYHSKRKSLLNAFKPDRADGWPIELRYAGAGTSLKCYAYYLGGLEGDLPARAVNFERCQARFICYDPFFYAASESSVAITTAFSVADPWYFIRRGTSGSYSSPGWPYVVIGGQVSAIVEAANGDIYVGGSFTEIGTWTGGAHMANTRAIAKYTPSTGTWSAVGTGALDGVVSALAIGPDGSIYAAGSFTQMGGVASTARVAKWNGSAWSALGSGIGNGSVSELAFGHDGSLYAVGTFTDHGDANGDYISKWNGSAWSSLGGGLNQYATGLAVGLDGSVYVGGMFTAEGGGGTAMAYIGKWDGSDWVNIGDAQTIVNALAVGPDGTLYAGGFFSSIGGVTASKFAWYNGSQWYGTGQSMDGYIYALAVLDDGTIYLGGSFTYAGPLTTTQGLVIWNGSSFIHPACDLPGSPSVYAIAETDSGIYIGYDTSGNAIVSGVTTVNNTGSATAYPRFTCKRNGGTLLRLEYLHNLTTGKTLWLNYALLGGETLTIDLTPGAKSITSDMFGDVIGRALLPPSDFATFNLAPGNNSILCYASQSGFGISDADCYFTPAHWGVDTIAT